MLVLVVLLIHEIRDDQNDTHRRQGTVQDIQPFGEIVIQPYGKQGSDDTSHQNHGLFLLMEDICQAQAGGVQSIVVGGPDVQAQHQNRQVEQIQTQHNLKNIISTHEDIGNGAEEEHQGVANEKCDHCRDGSSLGVLGEPGEVRRGRTARYEGTDHQARAAYDTQSTAGYGELIHNGSLALSDCHHHGDGSEHRYRRNRDVANDGQGLDSEVSRRGHTAARNQNQRPHAKLAVAQELICHRNGEHGHAHAEPADLGKADHGGGQIGALLTEGLSGQQVHAEAGLGSHIAQKSCIQS